MTTATTTIDIPPPRKPLTAREQAYKALNHALRCYNKMASRPRTGNAWAWMECELWNARADAVRLGALDRNSDNYVFVSDRLHDAQHRRQWARMLEDQGRTSVRV